MIAKSIEYLFIKVLVSYQHRFVSRNLILAIDLLITSFAFALACLLRFNFHVEDIPWGSYKYYLLFLLIVRCLFFLIFQSYSGIVRHTSMEDVRLIFRTVTVSTATIMMLSLGAYYLFNDTYLYIPISVLLIDYFICLFSLIASRLFVKSMYTDIRKNSSVQVIIPVIIYGAGSLGIITKNALLQDFGKYDVLCFVDDNPSFIGKSVEGIRVLSVESAIEKYVSGPKSLPQVILAASRMPPAYKTKLADLLLEYDIVARIVPSTVEWMDGKFDSAQIRNIRIEDLLGREQIALHDKNIACQLSGKRVMITGAAGSIGTELARQILNYQPASLHLLDQSESGLYDLEFDLGQNNNGNASTVSIICDVTDESRLTNVFAEIKPELVFHAAAYKHVPLMERFPYEAVKTNIIGSKNMATLSVRFGVQKFVLVSTDKAVNPTSIMGASKRFAEMYIQGLNGVSETKFITTRFGNVLGSNGSVVPLFKKQIESGGPVTVTDPEVIRYFMTIGEACQLVLEASAMGKGGEVFAFDMGEAVKIYDLACKMIRLSGFVVGKDIAIAFTGLRPGEKLYEELLADMEKDMPTHHPKIMIARMPHMDFDQTENNMGRLTSVLKTNNEDEIVSVLKSSVPEYISQNPMFEKLDSEIPAR